MSAFISVIAFMSSMALAQASGAPHTFYPDPAQVEAALATMMKYPKEEPYPGKLPRRKNDALRVDLKTKAGRKRHKNWLDWAEFWANKSDDFLYGMIDPKNPRSLVPSYKTGCPLHLGNIRTMLPVWGKRNTWRCTVGGEEWPMVSLPISRVRATPTTTATGTSPPRT